MSEEGEGVAVDLDLRQGDVSRLSPLGQSGAAVGLSPESDCLVALLSQTCDAVQSSKFYCLVAPVIEATPADVSAARKGKRPLLLFLDDAAGAGPWVADIERAFPVVKSQLLESIRVARCVDSASSNEARWLGARIGRVFSRFPFPNEVFPVFAKLQDRLRARSGTAGNLGQVIDLVAEIRVSANQWDAPGRRLKVHVIVPSQLLIPMEDADPSWTWSRVKGWRTSDTPGALPIDRVCELILASQAGDLTSLMHLWHELGQSLDAVFLQPRLDSEVTQIEVAVVPDLEFTHQDIASSESLDLETLSDSRGA